MMKKILFIIIVLTSVIITNSNSTIGSEKNEKYVSSFAGLRLRNKADISSQTLDLIPFMDKIQILEEKNEEVYISNRYGKWSYVSWNDKKGWIFSGFLSDYNITGLTENVSKYYKDYYKSGKNECEQRFSNLTSNDIQIVQIFQNFIIMKIPALCYDGGCDSICIRPVIWKYDKLNNKFIKFYDLENYNKSFDNDISDLIFTYLNDNNIVSLIAIKSFDDGQQIFIISDLNNILLNKTESLPCGWSSLIKKDEFYFDKCNKTKIQCLDDNYEKILNYSYDCKTKKFYKK